MNKDSFQFYQFLSHFITGQYDFMNSRLFWKDDIQGSNTKDHVSIPLSLRFHDKAFWSILHRVCQQGKIPEHWTRFCLVLGHHVAENSNKSGNKVEYWLNNHGKHIENLILIHSIIQSLKQEKRILVQVKNLDNSTWGFKLWWGFF